MCHMSDDLYFKFKNAKKKYTEAELNFIKLQDEYLEMLYKDPGNRDLINKKYEKDLIELRNKVDNFDEEFDAVENEISKISSGFTARKAKASSLEVKKIEHYIQGMEYMREILSRFEGRFTISTYDTSFLHENNIDYAAGVRMTLKVDPPLQNLPVIEESDNGVILDISDHHLFVEAMNPKDILQALTKIYNEH